MAIFCAFITLLWIKAIGVQRGHRRMRAQRAQLAT